MTTTYLAPYLKQRFVDANGNALYNGTVATYQAGTVTPIATYTDSTGGSANTNPIVLNPRGEADIWLLPNVAYKFIVNDSSGNLIWTEDNVVNSQLITLYGGVDTGSANAYVLNFTANFTSYADGIVIYWIPSHANTSASTININGLGVVNITNQDGSALTAGELLANQTAVIMFKGGAFLLLSTGNVPIAASFTGTLTGMTTTITQTVSYWIVGKMCMLRAPLTLGTSNATSMTMTGLPAAVTPATGTASITCVLEDNGGLLGGWAQVNSGTGTITFGTGFNNNQSGFTASGSKGLGAGWSISYPLG